MKIIKLLVPVLMVSALISCSYQAESTQPDVNPPKTLISYEKAFEQLDNYRNAHPGVNGDQYALRTWISIEDLENYIAYAKAEGKKNNISVNGIDFIFTQYKEGKPNMPNESNKDYELTFMYAPTYRDTVNNKNEAFDPMNSKPNEPRKLSVVFAEPELTDSTAVASKSEASSDSSNKGPSGIANNSQSCPNICP